jgi:hypothetical protein
MRTTPQSAHRVLEKAMSHTESTSSAVQAAGSLDLSALKGQAQRLQEQARARGEDLKRGGALETVAHQHGFRDWNAACAAASKPVTAPAAPRPTRSYRWLQTPQAFDFSKASTRKDFLAFMADLLNAGHRRHVPAFEPYGLNTHSNDLSWVVDAHNDWWVFFEESDPQLVRVQHRYGDQDALQALCDWVCYRWRLTQVDEPAQH